MEMLRVVSFTGPRLLITLLGGYLYSSSLMVYLMIPVCSSSILADFYEKTLAKLAQLAEKISFSVIGKAIWALQAS